MSWEQEDSLRRKVREARERQAFRADIKSVLNAKDAQADLLKHREVAQERIRQERAERDKARLEKTDQEKAERQQKSSPRITRHVREGREEKER
jgi:hypothetical protein